MGRMNDIAEWLQSDDEFSDTERVQQVVTVDTVRIMRELFPLRRINSVTFKVSQSTHMRAVLGQKHTGRA